MLEIIISMQKNNNSFQIKCKKSKITFIVRSKVELKWFDVITINISCDKLKCLLQLKAVFDYV